jgi:hypothetical protein
MTSPTTGVTPAESARLALAPCTTAAERRRETDQKLAGDLEQSVSSKDQARFLQREIEARRLAASRQRRAALARIDVLLLGDKIRVADLGDPRVGHGESVRALLGLLFSSADPCALEALESTILFAVFGMPFDAAAIEDIGPFREFPAIDAVIQRQRHEGRSLADTFAAMRPDRPDVALAYVDAVARATFDCCADGSAQSLSKPRRDHRLRQLLDTVRLGSEPLRVDIHLHARIEEVEGALGTPVPASVMRSGIA